MAWNARLSIEYGKAQERSRIKKIEHEGPLVLQKSFYPDASGIVHNYILHPPGGLVGGDHLQLHVRVREGAAVLLTTPAAGKIYRSPEQPSSFRLQAELDEGCELLWLPQENIVYEGAIHRSALSWTVHPSSRLTAWDIQCLGRPGSGKVYDQGRLVTELRLQTTNRLMLMERQGMDGGSAMLQASWGLAGFTAFGSMLLHWPDCHFRPEASGDHSADAIELGITQRDGWLLARARGSCPARIRERFLELLQEFHREHWGRAFTVPRIWAY
jgi:urease accessory protein